MTDTLMNADPPRRIRSFVLRQGRITASQKNALENLWPRYGLDPAAAFDPAAVFGRRAPLTLEIGFGNGESLAAMAQSLPAEDFIGAEVHPPGIGHLLIELERRGLDNVRVFRVDAVELLENCIPEGALARILVFFPDPWHKQRHKKRRLVSPAFARLAASRLAPGGVFHAATDWEDYAMQMLEVLNGCETLVNQAPDGRFSERPAYRTPTKFEQRGQRLGHGVWDLVYRRS
ncbi:tRNA (guanine-N(7)-)-methyltransferase [Methylococcus capsulatus str. Bath]|uniref:tRNA (guanine-N(7)-)-methyltransferase n=1 Tax=Methylococcus capsulatus (strain ATCC 33009 / NCIMB 11132 / Bath) TaxID=243233 RepID=TRMB_METCA|nr:tRNA (guanosine(46)-N7)-methyltransferase TrmB [Methylococcus capsulatus]Q608G0.1 RecName: Full=tRNA (guanine-N(7)-)-methyltransferase; AltName: Full=tRNA (guanine(46)-N(7))-methyltransferase; AltName: Full=tRNA(m7G46)-methyltransferase [Methylococcus capsulatus str. Bath]AAU92229.1 tRNA (guanine-N(7)-)-methyltransferase [Methylococcus capsulatus str. Bath]